jgi:hypothetical protein
MGIPLRELIDKHAGGMHDADYRAWSEAHRISPQLECALRRHWAESTDFLQ